MNSYRWLRAAKVVRRQALGNRRRAVSAYRWLRAAKVVRRMNRGAIPAIHARRYRSNYGMDRGRHAHPLTHLPRPSPDRRGQGLQPDRGRDPL